MIASLRGVLVEAGEDRVVLEAGGVGYEVWMAPAFLRRLPPLGSELRLHVVESVPLYGGGTSLYGFREREEKELFETIRDAVPNTGAKKALEILSKAGRSLPDFRRAVLDRDAAGLAEGFGFTRKTAEKLIASLREKLPRAPAAAHGAPEAPDRRALEALAALGYRPSEARGALEAAAEELAGREASLEERIRLALKRLAPR